MDAYPALDDLGRIDAELARLARGEALLRLRIGDALDALLSQDGHHELGFSTQKAYALERLSRSGRWAADTRALVRRLAPLPRMRRALEGAQISWSMAELLSRHATAEDEEAWLALAQGRTVHEMREAIRERTGDAADGAESEEEDRSLLTVTLPADEALELEAVQKVIEHLEGEAAAADWVEWLLAEGLCALLEHNSRKEPLGTEELDEALVAGRRAGAGVTGCEAWRWTVCDAANDQVERWDPEPLPPDVAGLDRRLRAMSAEMASRDLWLGEMLGRFLAARGWAKLGYASETEYARERLGMSRASMRGRVTLARRAAPLAPVGEAVRAGTLGTEAARLVSRVATPATANRWVERAQGRTFKHLREEVRVAEMCARYGGWSEETTAPPDEQDLALYHDLERTILSGAWLAGGASAGGGSEGVQISGAPSRAEPANDVQREDAVQISAPEVLGEQTPDEQEGEARRSGPKAARAVKGTLAPVTLKLWVRREVHLFWRVLERAHRKLRAPHSFPRFLCESFWSTWTGFLGSSDRWEGIYRRDRYRCTSPVCFRRDCTLHHMRYGRDEPEDLVSACGWCHLDGEHGGRLHIEPPASAPTWIIGREPILEVHGRDKRELG